MSDLEIDGVTLTTVGQSRVRADAPRGLRLQLLPSGLATAIGGLLGGQDVQLGDPAFDRAFMIKADDEALAAAWLDEHVRRALLEAEDFTYLVAGGEVIGEGTWGDAPRGPRRLPRTVLVAVAALAGTSPRLARTWRQAAAAVGVELSPLDEFPREGFTFDGRLGRVHARTVCSPSLARRPIWRTVVRVEARRATTLRYVLAPGRARSGRRLVEVEVEAEQEAEARALISPMVKRLLFAVDATVRVEPDAATVSWPGVEVSPERLRAAVTLLGELTGASAVTPYR